TITASNRAPTATISAPANNAIVNLGTSITFAGAGADFEDGPLSGGALVWTSSIDGQIGTGGSFSTSGLAAGVHTITLTAKDAQAATGTATRTVTINRPPTANMIAPAASAIVGQWANVGFMGNGTDPEDGTLSGASLVWTSSRDGQIGTGANFTRNNLTAGVHTISLTATDGQSAAAVATRVITVLANQ